MRGIAHQEEKQNDLAIKDFDEAIRLQPNYAASLYRRGMLKQEMGDPAGQADIALAKRLNPNVIQIATSTPHP